jgi:hypothetical protein
MKLRKCVEGDEMQSRIEQNEADRMTDIAEPEQNDRKS